jgi:dTDP-4-dehydrorhamnose 3,5-epimerase
MDIKKLDLEGVYEIILDPREDKRGFFMRTYDKNIFQEHGLTTKWIQESQSFSKDKNTVRGIHFQFPPYCETKLIRVPEGEIFAAFIDLRKGSDTFGNHGNIILSKERNNMLYIEKGFGMGICTLSENCNMLYKMDVGYSPVHQGEIKWDDPDIGIKWPISGNPTISQRDSSAISLENFIDVFGGL